MGVDKSDVLKKMREAEAIYVLMSDCTRMPFVVCDPETYDDQVLIFFSEEEAMKGGQEFLKEGNPLKIFNIENKYMLPFYSAVKWKHVFIFNIKYLQRISLFQEFLSALHGFFF